MLYPAGYYARQIPIEARLKVPAGWQMASALQRGEEQGDETHFLPTTLETLVDSPVYAGTYFARIDLTRARGSRCTSIYSPTGPSCSPPPRPARRASRARSQAYLLFGSRHYDHYDFLVTVSDTLPPSGVEHHRSSFDGVYANYFTEWDKSAGVRALLHTNLLTPGMGSFAVPRTYGPRTTTNRCATVCCGCTKARRSTGATCSVPDRGCGRSSRHSMSSRWSRRGTRPSPPGPGARYGSTEQPIIDYRGPLAWRSWQRATDYYDVGNLIWLDVHTLIRERSQGQRSLDDFAKQFFGVNDGNYSELTYTFADVVAALNRVQNFLATWAACPLRPVGLGRNWL